jgi:hypothetical protein
MEEEFSLNSLQSQLSLIFQLFIEWQEIAFLHEDSLNPAYLLNSLVFQRAGTDSFSLIFNPQFVEKMVEMMKY